MRIYEHQAKTILARFGVPIPAGRVARTPAEARRAAEEIGGPVMLKAQVNAGGRGKAGGILRAGSSTEVEPLSRRLLGQRLVTSQTEPEGRLVRAVLVEEACQVEREYYLGLTVDRVNEAVVLAVSPIDGADIEILAEESPALIFREYADPLVGLQLFQARKAASALGFQGELFKQAIHIIMALERAFMSVDAELVEVNPLALTRQAFLTALDAKVVLDQSALARHPDLAKLQDPAESSPLEVRAAKNKLTYIKLPGTIGWLANGAGLAMATMDMIQAAGGGPADFLDIGDKADEGSLSEALQILASDPEVTVILVNIFGALIPCDVVAKGLVRAFQATTLRVPLVIRLDGVNGEEGWRILRSAGLDFVISVDMFDAVAKAAALARGGRSAT
ncbi:MAG: ADP-forming succinate--CoA ligase subunit beta [Candidatus Aminicenantes bacterium]|nr:ADP-forming succinate--CoA ligase subunit beta [Candidatus Aminicenantes bacterium]